MYFPAADLEMENVQQERSSTKSPSKKRLGRPPGSKPKCSVCGTTGHNVVTCQQGAKPHQNSASTNGVVKSTETDAMSETEFQDVKGFQDEGNSSFVAAAKCRVPLLEVNIAYASADYEHYVSSRQKV
jgi:hypothetical protein